MLSHKDKKEELIVQLKSFITNVESSRFNGALDSMGKTLTAEHCQSRAERAKAVLKHLEGITVEKFEKIAFATEILINDLVRF